MAGFCGVLIITPRILSDYTSVASTILTVKKICRVHFALHIEELTHTLIYLVIYFKQFRTRGGGATIVL